MPDDNIAIDHVVDARGMPCPMPLLKAKQALAAVPTGGVIRVLATDAGSVRDFHSFIDLTEHILIEHRQENDTYTYIIRKGQK